MRKPLSKLACCLPLLSAMLAFGLAVITFNGGEARAQEPTKPAAQPANPQRVPMLAPKQFVHKDIYHFAWEAAAFFSYDTDRLDALKWEELAHKYCAVIKTEEDAAKYAKELLALVDDPFCKLESKEDMQALDETMHGTMAGIGIQFAAKKTADGKVDLAGGKSPIAVLDKDGYPTLEAVIPDGPAQQAGLTAGDSIIEVNGLNLKGKDNLLELTKSLKDKAGTKVKLTYRRAGADKTVDMERREVKRPEVPLPTRTVGKIGIIYIPGFLSDDTGKLVKDALTKLKDCEAYIIDVRDNPGGQVKQCMKVSSLFIDKGVLVTMRERVPEGYVKTSFEVSDKGLTQTFVDEKTGASDSVTEPREPNLTGKKPIVILTSKYSASAAEMFTGALKDNGRATVIGETTYGKGIGQKIIPGPFGYGASITTLRYFTPNGTWVGDGHKNRTGVTPTMEVKLPDTGDKPITEKDDTQTEAAIKFLNEKLGS